MCSCAFFTLAYFTVQNVMSQTSVIVSLQLGPSSIISICYGCVIQHAVQQAVGLQQI